MGKMNIMTALAYGIVRELLTQCPSHALIIGTTTTACGLDASMFLAHEPGTPFEEAPLPRCPECEAKLI